MLNLVTDRFGQGRLRMHMNRAVIIGLDRVPDLHMLVRRIRGGHPHCQGRA